MENKYNAQSGWGTPFDENKTSKGENPNINAEYSSSDDSVSKSQQRVITVELPEKGKEDDNSIQNIEGSEEIKQYIESAQNALTVVDDIVLKGYLQQLDKLEVISNDELKEEDIVLYKVNLMSYDKDEYATDKFVSAFSAMTFTSNTVVLIVDGHEDHTDFFIGVKNNDGKYTTSSIAETFKSSMQGQFPGIQLEDLSYISEGHEYSKQHRVLRDIKDATCVSSFVGIPSAKANQGHSNSSYIQGVEKFADAMRGKRYTAIIVARNQMESSVNMMRKAYENLYSQLSCMATQQLAYSTNESLAHAITRSQGSTHTKTHSESEGTTHTEGTSENWSKNKSKSTSSGESKPNFWSKGGQLAGPLMEAGSILTLSTGGVAAPVGMTLIGAGAVLGLGGILGSKTKSKNESTSEGESVGGGKSTNDGVSHNVSDSESNGETITDSEGNTSSIGTTKNYTLTVHNKHVEELLKRIDKQLQRIDNAEGNGLWSTSSYFLSYNNNKSIAQSGATIFRSIVMGEDSGVEASAINLWNIDNVESINSSKIISSIQSLSHPTFMYSKGIGEGINVEGTSLVSSKELAMLMGLPRKSVPGLPVINHISLGKQVIRHNIRNYTKPLDLGVIYDHGEIINKNKVEIDSQSLTLHTFVTGSTGSGKSETVYRLISQAQKAGATFLIVEPAKGEYKNVYGNANVFGTNPLLTPILKINPFKFPKGIHVLEHIDRLAEIFNVCWPMYAAMPSVLKKSLLRTYENCKWNLSLSTNAVDDNLFPTFSDLLDELKVCIKESAYSEEVKGNYEGSLVTRVESLTNGLNGEIFCGGEISDEILFDQNTIVDLSRIGSQETKSLIMGILIMRLNEYRTVNAEEANSKLRHITVLEEAHNILKRVSTEQSSEGSNVAGKAVEMISNSIAEMRTFGEGFIIVDQSPTSVHSSAIKNTNTKIIMRLPDGDDRLIAGKSSAMKDNQIDDIAMLPTGVAVVYQNDWMQPVLCKISIMDDCRVKFEKKTDCYLKENYAPLPVVEILKMLLKGRMATVVNPDKSVIYNGINNSRISTSMKLDLLSIYDEYNKTGRLLLWNNDYFVELSSIVSSLLGLSSQVEDIANRAKDFKEMNSLLSELIKLRYKDIPQYMDLTLRQILMRNFAEANVSHLRIYSAWINDIKTNVKQ